MRLRAVKYSLGLAEYANVLLVAATCMDATASYLDPLRK